VSAPGLLVLDFDGVVCDGMDEFFESAWRAWERLARVPRPDARREDLRARFGRLRPIVEAGWEMALLPALLAETDPARDVELREVAGWAAARDAFMRAHALSSHELAGALDAARDAWFGAERESWLRAHRFYPGVADWLKKLGVEGPLVYVLSTKEKRFLDYLLAWQGIPLPGECVIGKATPRRAKWDVIAELAARHGLPPDGAGAWFVEDRLPTLLELRKDAPHLRALRLFLAAWGYVFAEDLQRAGAAGIPVLTLEQATSAFSAWPA
jgi:phosphoglycolate phosphatase-like HAD superfamily hydrolase